MRTRFRLRRGWVAAVIAALFVAILVPVSAEAGETDFDHNPGGEMYSLLTGDVALTESDTARHGAGAYIMGANGAEKWRYTLPEGKEAWQGYHPKRMVFGSDGTIYSYVEKREGNNLRVTERTIQAYRNGELLWEIPPPAICAPTNPGPEGQIIVGGDNLYVIQTEHGCGSTGGSMQHAVRLDMATGEVLSSHRLAATGRILLEPYSEGFAYWEPVGNRIYRFSNATGESEEFYTREISPGFVVNNDYKVDHDGSIVFTLSRRGVEAVGKIDLAGVYSQYGVEQVNPDRWQLFGASVSFAPNGNIVLFESSSADGWSRITVLDSDMREVAQSKIESVSYPDGKDIEGSVWYGMGHPEYVRIDTNGNIVAIANGWWCDTRGCWSRNQGRVIIVYDRTLNAVAEHYIGRVFVSDETSVRVFAPSSGKLYYLASGRYNSDSNNRVITVPIPRLGYDYNDTKMFTNVPPPSEPLNYVALGNSYSSGEGAGDANETYYEATDRPGINECHRSRVAYPVLLATKRFQDDRQRKIGYD